MVLRLLSAPSLLSTRLSCSQAGIKHRVLPAGVWGRVPLAMASTQRCSSASSRRCAGPSKSARPWCARQPLTPGAVMQHAGQGAE